MRPQPSCEVVWLHAGESPAAACRAAGDARQPVRRGVFAALDGSPVSCAALSFAAAVARDADVPLTVALMLPGAGHWTSTWAAAAGVAPLATTAEEVERMLRTAIAQLDRDQSVTYRSCVGSLSVEALAQLRDGRHDLVVLGLSSWIDRWSTARRLGRESGARVVCVRLARTRRDRSHSAASQQSLTAQEAAPTVLGWPSAAPQPSSDARSRRCAPATSSRSSRPGG